MAEPAIVTSGLTRRFNQVVAVNDLNLRVNDGEVHGIIGPNGAGKSTTFRLLLGLLQPSAGAVRIIGKDPVAHGDFVRQYTGVALETRGLDERYNAWNTLDYHGRIWGLPRQERLRQMEELLHVFGLWDNRYEIIAGWGRGMKQRLSLARSLLPTPRLLLLDEPYAGLDEIVAASITDHLCNMVDQTGMTVLMATSNLSITDRCCDHMTILHKGRALVSGSMSTIHALGHKPAIKVTGRGFCEEIAVLLLRRPEVASVNQTENVITLKLTGNVDTAPLVSLIIESGAEVTEVRKQTSSLSEVFGALVQDDEQISESVSEMSPAR